MQKKIILSLLGFCLINLQLQANANTIKLDPNLQLNNQNHTNRNQNHTNRNQNHTNRNQNQYNIKLKNSSVIHRPTLPNHTIRPTLPNHTINRSKLPNHTIRPTLPKQAILKPINEKEKQIIKIKKQINKQEIERINKLKTNYLRKKNLKIKKMELELLELQQRIKRFELLNKNLENKLDTSAKQVSIVNKVLNKEIDLNDLKETINKKELKTKPLKSIVTNVLNNVKNNQKDYFDVIEKDKLQTKIRQLELKLKKEKIISPKKKIKNKIKKEKMIIPKKRIKIKKTINKKMFSSKKRIKTKKIIADKKINKKEYIYKKHTLKYSQLHFKLALKEKINLLAYDQPSFTYQKVNNRFYKIINRFLIKNKNLKDNTVINNQRDVYLYNKDNKIIALIFKGTKIKTVKINNIYSQILNNIYINKKNIIK